jgi:hypothetical protein
VLGLRWDTERDEISVDVTMITARRRKDIEDSADLSCPEASLPDRITRRVLWRVAQSQYDPPGALVCLYSEADVVSEEHHNEGEVQELGDRFGQEEEMEFPALLKDMRKIKILRAHSFGQFKKHALLKACTQSPCFSYPGLARAFQSVGSADM